MKRFSFFVLLGLSAMMRAQDTKLYPAPFGHKWGYINAQGKVVIQPQFYSAGDFSDGIAAVRVKGTYGYIDAKGNFAIKPGYDLALAFDQGLAKVFLDGKPYFIDHKGKIAFEHYYAKMAAFGSKNSAVVETNSGKKGMIDRKGKLVIDTAFSYIGVFSEGRATVVGISLDESKSECGVIDSLGNWIVPYGLYRSISVFHDGVARVDDLNEKSGVIDRNGKYLFTVPESKWNFGYSNEDYHDGLAIVDINFANKTNDYSSDNAYPGAVNKKGEIVFSNKTWNEITAFDHHRAFARDKNDHWILIDEHGKQVGNTIYLEVAYESDGYSRGMFDNGKAFVETWTGWCAIDTAGKVLSQAGNIAENYERVYRAGDILFFQEDISEQSDDYAFRYGFWNERLKCSVSPRFHSVEIDDFTGSLMMVSREDELEYIDETGKVIWKEPSSAESETKLNIDYMNRGHYYASSPYRHDLAGYGGWGGSDNESKKIPRTARPAEKELQLVIDTNLTEEKWADRYDAYKMFVINGSDDTLFFEAQDSRLYLKLQAQDQKGEWRDIEYIPNSWCGNSYHTLFLAGQEFWEFTLPQYEGELKTKMRAALQYKTSKKAEEKTLYSNAISVSVNPGQFWNRRAYERGGIMDPYSE